MILYIANLSFESDCNSKFSNYTLIVNKKKSSVQLDAITQLQVRQVLATTLSQQLGQSSNGNPIVISYRTSVETV